MVHKAPATLDARLEASDDSEDEDYDPSAASKKQEQHDDEDSGKEDELGAYDSGDEKTVGKTLSKSPTQEKSIDDTHDIKTRSQRAQETETITSATPGKSNANVDDLWSAMNAPKTKQSRGGAEEETITIDRTYTFAGEVRTERKVVPKHSQEARDHLASMAASQTSATTTPEPDTKAERLNESGKPLRKIFKRKSTLGDTKPRKLNTLEKSRMEWSGFVDREGINEDLKRGNQAGYLDKVDFLRESEAKMHDRFKAGQKSTQK